jgi:beta-alanine--pyruvate transaminase
LDFAPAFQFAHPGVFELSSRLAAMAPGNLNQVFLVNSGSEACEAALKIARAYWRKAGALTRTRLIGREKAYHGVNFGGISVGGLPNNRDQYAPLLPGTEDHLPLPYDKARMAFTKGEPETGADYADALEGFVAQHGADSIAAVIVEPMVGSAGVFAPPRNYLRRLREITARHCILLIFDEVITAFGRLGADFASKKYGVTPDMIVFAKAITNGAVPMGGVIVSDDIRAAFPGPGAPDHAIDLFHGHTYTGHPLACAAALATLDLYARDSLFERAAEMAPTFEAAVHSLKDAPFVVDIRNCGLAAGIELQSDPAAPGRRGYDFMRAAFWHENLVTRISGDTIALAPALIASEDDIARMVDGVRRALSRLT